MGLKEPRNNESETITPLGLLGGYKLGFSLEAGVHVAKCNGRRYVTLVLSPGVFTKAKGLFGYFGGTRYYTQDQAGNRRSQGRLPLIELNNDFEFEEASGLDSIGSRDGKSPSGEGWKTRALRRTDKSLRLIERADRQLTSGDVHGATITMDQIEEIQAKIPAHLQD